MASEAETVKPDEPAATAQVRESPDVISADGSQPNEQEVKHGAAEMAKPIEATAQTNDAAEALNTLSLEPSNEPIRATKLFIGGLSYDTTDDSLGEYFAQFGEVVEAVVKFHRQTGEHRGFGFVTLRSADAVRAILSQSHTIDGTLVAPPVLARSTRGPAGVDVTNGGLDLGTTAAAAGTAPPKIFVGGLSHSITEDHFRVRARRAPPAITRARPPHPSPIPPGARHRICIAATEHL